MSTSGTSSASASSTVAAAAKGVDAARRCAGKPLTDKLAAAADPDAALEGLLRLVDALDEAEPGSGAQMLTEVADDEGTAMRLCACSGPARR